MIKIISVIPILHIKRSKLLFLLEMVNTVEVAVIGQCSETLLDYYRYLYGIVLQK
ncbi:MAG: hypothetical protein SGI87_11300 [Flavobacteriales bacterium]|nr:hypothetical protein [Flavobacteriales bacterium]